MNLKEYKRKAMENPDFRREYERLDLAFEVGQEILKARITKGLTQDKLARILGTKQTAIARLENGRKLPSLSYLERIAKALGMELKIPRLINK